MGLKSQVAVILITLSAVELVAGCKQHSTFAAILPYYLGSFRVDNLKDF